MPRVVTWLHQQKLTDWKTSEAIVAACLHLCTGLTKIITIPDCKTSKTEVQEYSNASCGGLLAPTETNNTRLQNLRRNMGFKLSGEHLAERKSLHRKNLSDCQEKMESGQMVSHSSPGNADNVWLGMWRCPTPTPCLISPILQSKQGTPPKVQLCRRGQNTPWSPTTMPL